MMCSVRLGRDWHYLRLNEVIICQEHVVLYIHITYHPQYDQTLELTTLVLIGTNNLCNQCLSVVYSIQHYVMKFVSDYELFLSKFTKNNIWIKTVEPIHGVINLIVLFTEWYSRNGTWSVSKCYLRKENVLLYKLHKRHSLLRRRLYTPPWPNG